MDIEPNETRPRDVSFSSYHRMVGENFVLNLPEPIHKPSPVTGQTPSRRRATKGSEGELGVFAAERYYNATIEDNKAGHETPTIAGSYATNLGYVKQKSRKQNLNVGTPSMSSEASSSMNSQGALLSIKRSNKASRSSFFSGLSCSGRSCSDKNSVTICHQMPPEQQRKPIKKSEILQIDPKLVVFDGTKQSLPRYLDLIHPTDDHVLLRSPMSIVSSSNISESSFRRLQLALGEETLIKDEEEDPRVSLQVFGSANLKKGTGEISMNLERKLSMLSWDAIPKTQSITTTSTVNVGGGMACHDEIESDASSDLFEIENISSNSGSLQQQHPRFTHTASSCMVTATSVYEPSEASIEWSVITASAADFSLSHDYDEKKVEMLQIGSKNLGKSGQRSRSGGILGCNSHKAVRVVEPGPVYKIGGGGT